MITDVEMKEPAAETANAPPAGDSEMMKKKKSGIEMIREKFKEWDAWPYKYQFFNKDESPNWCPSIFTIFRDDAGADRLLNSFYDLCRDYQSFDFSIEPLIIGEVKRYSFSDLQAITNFKPGMEIQETLSGRLFHGTIVEGSENRPVIVKTWDYLMPLRVQHVHRLYRFCDEIELLTDGKANLHPNLVKLYGYCFDRRLAVVYDGKLTRVLSNVILADNFGWGDRMKVATQLAELLAWLHEKRIAVGTVTAACIMMDDEVNIKVFDFGYVSNHVNEGCKIPVQILVHPDAPEVFSGERTMKSDVYIFGLLLLELIAKKKFDVPRGPAYLRYTMVNEANNSGKYLVNECFKEVDHPTAFDITLLIFNCLNIDQPDERPAMKEVLDLLKAIRIGGEKRKRDEDEAEQNKRYLTTTLLD